MSPAIVRLAALLCAALFPACLTYAQSCSDESAIRNRLGNLSEDEKRDFMEDLERARFFGSVLRWTAVAQAEMIPILHALTQPSMNFNSIPAEAQISLAKLGDDAALRELEAELFTTPGGGYAVDKLIHVGTNRSFSLLISFLKVYIHDASLTREYGDYSDDVRWHIVAAVSTYASDAPTIVDSANPFDVWLAWWQEKKGNIALSISNSVADPYLACLARKVEWGFPDAILDMGSSSNPQAIPVLRILERIEPSTYTLNSIRGRAVFALAKLGDKDSMDFIESAVIEYGSQAHIDMLWKIGGATSIEVLVKALDSTFPKQIHGTTKTPDPSDKKNYAHVQKLAEEYRRITDVAILNTLNAMVVDPPHLSGDVESQIRQWKGWWPTHKATTSFRIPQLNSSE